jgi:hypothetical protein
MDAFYANVELRDRPELADKPVAVGGGMITTSNYVARKFGVRSAMPEFIARKLCPKLIVLPCDFTKYTAVAAQLRAVIAEYDPRFKAGSLDEVYFDLTDAVRAKLSTVQRGYYRDPFICHFSKSLLSHRKLATECSPIEPIIRRGTFIRTCVMDRAIASFLSLISSSSSKQQTYTTQPPLIAQIVNLGCGRDTNFLRLWTGNLLTQQRQSCLLETVQLRWYDIDFPPIIESKAELMRTCPDFPCSVQQSSFAQSSYYIYPNTPPYYTLNSKNDVEPKTHSYYNQQSTDIHPYHLVSFDLDQSPKDLFQLLIERHSFDPSVPTLFLLECVHMYLQGILFILLYFCML